jgi:lipopolysaccharide/colanic/teichoic acid biosynthesis glycosyltransferase
VLCRQDRVGRNGRRFALLRLRTARPGTGPGRLGRWLRATSLDGLPQLFNVVRGDMGLVGPRPERPEFVAQLAERIPYYVERHYVKPGVTGWAQLCYPYGSSERDALEKLQYELYYIKNNSLLFDLAILVQTVEVVLMGKGAR